MADALFEITLGRVAKAGGDATLARQRAELDVVRFAELVLDEPRQQVQLNALSYRQAGGKQSCRIDGKEAYPVKRDRSGDDLCYIPGQAVHTGGAVHEPDDVSAGANPAGAGHVFDGTPAGKRARNPGIWDGKWLPPPAESRQANVDGEVQSPRDEPG